MIIESSTIVIRSQIANVLLSYKAQTQGLEETALDLVEIIARRLPAATDIQVFNLGCFVRTRLAQLVSAPSLYEGTVKALVHAAQAAKLSPSEFQQSISCQCPTRRPSEPN